MLNPLSAFLSSRLWRNHVLPDELTKASRIIAALGAIQRRWPTSGSDLQDSEAPIFILSAGWGSGSTLLQRLVASGGKALIWGEPFDHAATIQRLATSLHALNDNWPRQEYFIKAQSSAEMADSWIANLTPQFDYLRSAHRNFLLNWLKVPAVDLGYPCWGLKEVRLTADHAYYLKWLFPNAKFLFIYRDVMDTFLSCKRVDWHSVWPDYRTRRPSLFAHHWRLLLEGFIENVDKLGGILIKFEDLTAGEIDTKTISEYVEAGPLDLNVLKRVVGSRRAKHHRLNRIERFVITSAAGDLRRKLYR